MSCYIQNLFATRIGGNQSITYTATVEQELEVMAELKKRLSDRVFIW